MTVGSWARRVIALAVALAVALAAGGGGAAAQAPAAPDAAVAAARAAQSDTARGASLRVVLLTVGSGEQVWERFGHNLLWIRDERTGESVAWNWGLFRFDEPGFYRRFLFGNTRYWMEGEDVATALAWYQRLGREVVAQELALSPGQRAALDAFVRVNARDEFKYYRYDYYIDNCSTRLRDALDVALGGALRTALEARPAGAITYRSESLRLVQHSTALFLGMDVALGRPADKELSEWQAAFIPMRLRDALRDVSVPADGGGETPLVAREYVAVPGAGVVERADIGVARHARIVGIAAMVLVTAILVAGVLARAGVRWARVLAVSLGVLVHSVLGVLATALLFMWCFTRHDFWDWNAHLLLMTPNSLVVAALLPRASRAGAAGTAWLGQYHLVMAAISLVVAVGIGLRSGASTPAGAALLMTWAHAVWVLYVAIFLVLLWRRDGADPPEPPDAAAMRMAA